MQEKHMKPTSANILAENLLLQPIDDQGLVDET